MRKDLSMRLQKPYVPNFDMTNNRNVQSTMMGTLRVPRVHRMNNINNNPVQNNVIPLNGRRFLMENEMDYDRKCVLLGNLDGLQEVCVGADFIQIKKYIQRIFKADQMDEVFVEIAE